MAVLSTNNRQRVWRGLMRYWSSNLTSIPFIKDDLQLAVNAMDDFLEANAAAINSAYPQPFRGAASTAQKALVLAIVALARTDPELAKRILGDID